MGNKKQSFVYTIIASILFGILLTIVVKSRDLDFSGSMPILVISTIVIMMLSVIVLAISAYRRK